MQGRTQVDPPMQARFVRERAARPTDDLPHARMRALYLVPDPPPEPPPEVPEPELAPVLLLPPVVPEGVAVPGPEVVPVPPVPEAPMLDEPMPVLLVLVPVPVVAPVVALPLPMVLVEPVLEVRVVDWQPAARAATMARLTTVTGRRMDWLMWFPSVDDAKLRQE